jgi:hypothetical protein
MNHGIVCVNLNKKVFNYLIYDDKTLNKYFQKAGGYRGSYLVSMKSMVAKELHKRGYKLIEITRILNLKEHATIINLIKREFIKEELEFINLHFDYCILKSMYPLTVSKRINERHIKTYKLEKI